MRQLLQTGMGAGACIESEVLVQAAGRTSKLVSRETAIDHNDAESCHPPESFQLTRCCCALSDCHQGLRAYLTREVLSD